MRNEVSMQDFDPTDPKNIAAMQHVHALLKYIGDDPGREGLHETPKRVLAAFNALLSARHM